MNVQFGCGSNLLIGWENHDIGVDVRNRLPFNDGEVDMILAEHLVEHLTSHEGLRFVRECHRILKSGGILRVCIPTLEKLVDRAHAVDLIEGHGHVMLYAEQSIRDLMWAGGFNPEKIVATERKDIDGHHKVIGAEKDDTETCRLEATKI